VILAALVVVGVGTAPAPADRAPVSAGGTDASVEEARGDIPLTYGAAAEAGTEGDVEWGNCDPTTGRLQIPSVYAPPCVPRWDEGADNGGATHVGVTEDTIKLVRYVPAQGTDLAAALQAFLDPPDKQRETEHDYLKMMEDLYETYGRRIEIVDFQATGVDDASARRDAQQVAKEIKPFASLSGPSLNSVYAEELAANGILCIGCGLAVPDSKFQEIAPHLWGSLATPEQYLVNLGDYIVNRLKGRNAEFAGPELRDQERVFGVVHFEQDPPVFNEVRELVEECGARLGYESAVTETYTLDLAKAPERASTIITKMKAAGVTTVIFLGDPLFPQNLTSAATAENYFPEWVVTGTVLTDTSTFGRSYDQQQWAHAFGISTLPTPTTPELRDNWRLYDWYYGEDPPAPGTSTVIYPTDALVMLGIHLAGPKLTPETFRAGLFAAPAAGGGPTAPQLSYGDADLWDRPLCDREGAPDYVGVDDMTEIWWDPAATGPDERGNEGTGLWRYANGGARYLPGEMPATPPDAFEEDGSVLRFEPEDIPEEDRWPEYPPPPTSPAGGATAGG
jgi:hypothetical protein